MRARLLGATGRDDAVSERPLWWPPNRLCGRYLAPYLSHRVGGEAVMLQDAASASIADPSDAIEGPRPFAELADLAPLVA